MEIHIGDRVADVTLVSKEGNKVQLTIDGQPYEPRTVTAPSCTTAIHSTPAWCAEREARTMMSIS